MANKRSVLEIKEEIRQTSAQYQRHHAWWRRHRRPRFTHSLTHKNQYLHDIPYHISPPIILFNEQKLHFSLSAEIDYFLQKILNESLQHVFKVDPVSINQLNSKNSIGETWEFCLVLAPI